MTCLLLHSSGYSSVFLSSAASSGDRELTVFKVYNKDYPLQPRHWLNISRECTILSCLGKKRVDGVVQLLSVADTSKHFSLQFKACLGGNLYQCLERRECCEEQELCVRVIIPLLRVLVSLHSCGIIHRDVKPENVFFESDGKLVLGDFGLAIDSHRDKPCSRVGTPEFMAPEVLSQPSADTMALRNIPTSMLTPYGPGVDIWAVGTLVHEALTGKVPFYHPEPAVAALKAQYGRPNRLPADITPECQAFVDAALRQDAATRPSAAELLKHPWVQQHAAAAAAAVAERVKAKALALLQLDRPLVNTATCAQHSSLRAADHHFGSSALSLRAADHHLGSSANSLGNRGTVGAASTGANNGTSTAHASAAADKQVCASGSAAAGSASKADSTSSSSNMSSFTSTGSGISGACTDTTSSSSSPLPSVAQALVALASVPAQVREGCKLLQQQQAASTCSCSGGKVPFHCSAVEPTHDAEPHAAAAGTVAALTAAAAGAQVELGRRGQQGCSQTAVVAAAASMQLAGVRVSSGAAADPSGSVGSSSSAAAIRQLQLLPALSEPVLLDVTAHTPDSQGSGAAHGSAEQCCYCSSSRRSSESGTCSAEVAAATAAGTARMHPTWSRGPAATASAAAGGVLQHSGSSSSRLKCACNNDSSGCVPSQALVAAHSAPAHTGDLQTLRAGHQSRWLGTLSASSTARQLLQPGGSSCTPGTSSSTPAAAAPVAVPDPVKAAAAHQKLPPRLRPNSVPTLGYAAGGPGTGPKPLLLFSPPKPALLMQRLRNFGTVPRVHGAAGGSSSSTHVAWQRRHSLDVVAESSAPDPTAPAAATPAAVPKPLAATDAVVDVADTSADPPSPGSQRITKQQAAMAGLVSPLAALCKLSGLLSPPRGAAAAAAAAAGAAAGSGQTHVQCAPSRGGGSSISLGPGSRALRRPAGVHATRHGTACAATGMEALMLGWAGAGPSEVQAEMSWGGQEVTGAQISSTRGCKSARGVCMKVLKQVLRHQQHA